ncbi:MAG: flagellar hook-length control protein FliK [Clostridium sp.]|nr:flagellar hook-length control protein FliK [Clostridium sp.]
MNINNLGAFIGNFTQSGTDNTDVHNIDIDNSSFQTIMSNVDNNDTKDMISKELFVSELDNTEVTEKTFEYINEFIENIENESQEETIMEELVLLLQTLNIPIVDNTSLPIKIDLEFDSVVDSVESSNLELGNLNTLKVENVDFKSLSNLEFQNVDLDNLKVENFDLGNANLSDADSSDINLDLETLKLDSLDKESIKITVKNETTNILNKEVLEVFDSNESLNIENINTMNTTDNLDNIDKLLTYLVDKNGVEIKKENFIEVIETSNFNNDENEFKGIDIVKMVFNIDSDNTVKNNDDDILTQLILSNIDDNTEDSETTLNEENIIISEIINNKESNFENIVTVDKPINIDKETITTDIVTNIKYMTKNNLQQLTVKIYPKELGEITIKLLSEDGIMKADIKSISKETYNLLNSNIEEIKKYLVNENIAINEVNIELYNEDTTYFSGQGFESMFHKEKEKENYFIESNENISIEEEGKQEEILNEVSNVNLLA